MAEQFSETKSMQSSDGMKQVIAAARAGVAPKEIDPDTIYHVGVDGREIDLEYLLPTPRRAMGDYVTATVESFTDLVDRLGAPSGGETATIWVDMNARQVVAVFNDNTGEAAGWGDLRATLPLVVTDEWEHWTGKDNVMMAQEAFAEHIEDGVPELVAPDAATMLEIAQSINATVNTEVKSAKRIDNGEIQMVYVEHIDGSAGQKGELKIPQTFDLAIAPFLGEDTYAVKARLRYRISGGQLRIGYHLERPNDVVLDAVEQIKNRLDEKYPDLVFLGVPAIR